MPPSLPAAPLPRLALHLGLGLVGAALLALPAAHYRIDRVTCDSWPPPHLNWALAATYLAAVALLAVGWRGFVRAGPPLGVALGAGLLVHLVALAAPPFLSTDPLFYAAIGRAMARYHASPYAPLATTLPADDGLLRLLSRDWQLGTSAYFPGWNELCSLLARVAPLVGEDLAVQLRLHQALGLVAMLLAAGLTGVAVGQSEPGRAGRAAATVLLCPLAVIEGTVSAHNDVLLAVAVALLAVAVRCGRRLVGLAAAALALGVKASALLPVGFVAVAWVVGRRRWRAAGLAVGLALGVGAVWLGPTLLVEHIGRFTDLVSPTRLQCDRAIECVPRWLLWRGRHPTAALAVGLAFRVAGALWLLGTAARAGRDGRLLPWLATGLGIYYLYFHAYVQPWYLLPLLPLLPFAAGRTRRALAVAGVTWLGPAAATFVFNCRASTAELWLERGLGVALVVLPPTVVLVAPGLLAGARAALARRVGDRREGVPGTAG